MAEGIIDRGRGPEIAGTRITISDGSDYVEAGWRPARIAALLGPDSDQVAVISPQSRPRPPGRGLPRVSPPSRAMRPSSGGVSDVRPILRHYGYGDGRSPILACAARDGLGDVGLPRLPRHGTGA